MVFSKKENQKEINGRYRNGGWNSRCIRPLWKKRRQTWTRS
jgi:hypothetical protein